MYLGTVAASILGYLIGSVSFSIIIVYLKTRNDIREHGSKNAGATNVSRVLGKKWGLAIVGLDMLKVLLTAVIAMAINTIPSPLVDQTNFIIPAFFALVGHCYPIYYKFKGGKAVSCILAIALLTNIMLFVIFMVVFLLVSMTTRRISPASIASAVAVSAICFVPQIYGIDSYILDGSVAFGQAYDHGYYWLNFSNAAHVWNAATPANKNGPFYDSMLTYQIVVVLSSILLIWKHRANIVRIFKGTEPIFFEFNKEKQAEKKKARLEQLEKINQKKKVAE
jgi:glycerol-3-phosphate acyltransferase PlsY